MGITLTVFFDGQFWVGIFERTDDGKLTVSRKVFGAEPKDQQLHETVHAEGTFALTKEDLNCRRFLCRGKPKVSAEWSLLSIAANILKLHHKLKNDRLGAGLVIPQNFSAAM